MTRFGERIIGAAKLRSATYEDVEHDNTAITQALAVVMLSSIATALGAGIHAGAGDVVRGTVLALISWLFWAGLTFFIGTKILGTQSTHATWGELLRTTGFAASPGLLRVLGVFPFTTSIVFFVTSVWMLMAFVIAVKAALDYNNIWRAVAVCLAGWIVYVTFGIFVY
jgi:hypothetical protein